VVTHIVPGGTGLVPAAHRVVAAVLANVINKPPAALLLIPAVSGRAGPVLAVLIGVNTGPNLTYVGSLATLLWRRVLIRRGEELPSANSPSGRDHGAAGAHRDHRRAVDLLRLVG